MRHHLERLSFPNFDGHPNVFFIGDVESFESQIKLRWKIKTRNMSSSKKKKKRKDSLKPSAAPIKVAAKSEKINVFAMMLGIVTSLVLIFVLTSEPVKTDAEQEKIAARKLERAKARQASIDETLIELRSLKTTNGDGVVEQVDICSRRIELANQLVERVPNDQSIRKEAVSEFLLANVKLYGLDFQSSELVIEGVGDKLEQAYRPYLDDESDSVRRNARVALLTHQTFETIKKSESDPESLVSLYSDTIERFPRDSYVASMVESHIVVLLGANREYTASLFEQLRQRYPIGSLDPVFEDRFQNVADRLQLREADFDRKLADRWANGADGRAELVATSGRLLSRGGVGIHLVTRINSLGQWLERNAFYEQAVEVYRQIGDSVKDGSVLQRHRQMADQISRSGLIRCSLDTTQIDYRGIDYSDRELVDEELKENVVIVVFWSESSPDSIVYLKALSESGKTLGNKTLSILAVCLDDDVPMNSPVLENKSPIVRIVMSEHEGQKNSLLQQCPPGNLPHVMLVGFDGIVDDVNTEPMQVRNRALHLLINRNK